MGYAGHFLKNGACDQPAGKVAKGLSLPASENMSHLKGVAPAGFHSIHGMADKDTVFSMDELVVFEEASILPYAIVEYSFNKK